MFKKLGVFFMLIFTAIAAFVAYNYLFSENISEEKKEFGLFVYPNTSLDSIIKLMETEKVLINSQSFKLLAENNKATIKPGYYKLKAGMTNRQILRLFTAGLQTPVKVSIVHARTNEDLAKLIAKQLIFNEEDILPYLNSRDSLAEYNFDPISVKSMIIPNTYEFYWTSTPKKFLDKMFAEYQKFWNDDRIQKAEKIGLSPLEVSTLASIVQAEQSKNITEQPTIAGLYMNRLRKKIPLQADPTVIYAIQDFNRKRLLKSDLQIDSPYNTYKYAGLPPGPINLPSINALDAVLNYVSHEYIYMCAKDDFSGFHYFSTTLNQHQIYAQRYQKALNNRGIKK